MGNHFEQALPSVYTCTYLYNAPLPQIWAEVGNNSDHPPLSARELLHYIIGHEADSASPHHHIRTSNIKYSELNYYVPVIVGHYIDKCIT